MADGFPIQTNFTSGEVSPYLKGRTDVNRYFNGADKLQNFIVKPQGGILRRSGTRFVNEVKDSSSLTILRRFEFSSTQSYVLEFGNNYIRFYRNGALLVNGGPAVEVVTPYTTADLRQLYFAQSADVLFICHPNYFPRRLSRLSDISWVLDLVPTVDGPYKSNPENADARIIYMQDTAIATSASALFTLSGTAKTITNVHANATLIELTVPGHGYTNGTIISVYGVLGTVEANGIWSVLVTNANNFRLMALDTNISYFVNPWISGGKVDVLPATSARQYVEFTQNNVYKIGLINGATSTTTAYVNVVNTIKTVPDTVGVVASFQSSSGGFNYYNLTADHAGVFDVGDIGKKIRVGTSWYGITSKTSDSVVVGYLQNVLTVSINNPVTISNRFQYAHFKLSAAVVAASDVGRQIRFNFVGFQLPGTIFSILPNFLEGYVNFGDNDIPYDYRIPATVPAVLAFGIVNNGVATSWKLGAWSAVTGYPRCVCFHEQRLWFASTPYEPQTLWSSVSQDYYNFAPTGSDSVVVDSSAITATIASSTVNSIVWMSSGPTLLLGTIGGEWQIKPASLTNALSPTDFSVTQQTSYGSSQIIPQRVGTGVIFIQRSGQKVREMIYNFQFDQYEAKDLTIVSEHIIRVNGKAIDASYQQEPSCLFWVVTDQGALSAMTYQKDQEVIAWHNHPIGGNGFVEAVATIPSIDGKNDTTYLIVKRTINGVTKRYVEYFEAEFWPATPDDKNNMFFVDCGLSYSGTPVSTVGGLSHLEGQTVQVIADGSSRSPTSVVTGGSVTFDGAAASNVSVGLQYTSLVKIMPLESGSQQGTAQGKVKRISKAVVRVLNSLGFSLGENLNTLENVSFRTSSDPMDSSPQLFTGDRERKFTGSYQFQADLYITQSQPYPLTVIAIMPHLDTNT